MDGQENSTFGENEAGATYVLINAIDPYTDTSLDPNGLETRSSPVPVPAPQPARSSPNSVLQTESVPQDEHRRYPDPSTQTPAPSGVPSLSQRTYRSAMSPSRTSAECSYGTFGDHQRRRPNPKGRSWRVVTFELSADHEDKSDRGAKYSNLYTTSAILKTDVGGEEDIRVDNACLLTREDVDHMCDDASERVRYRPSASHWRQILVATFLLCPIGGIVSAIFAYKSKRYYDTGQREVAKRMLRHSDFCLRCATIFGIIFWFLIFLLLVVNKEKLV